MKKISKHLENQNIIIKCNYKQITKYCDTRCTLYSNLVIVTAQYVKIFF